MSRYLARNGEATSQAYFLGCRVLVRLMNASTSQGSKRSCFPIRWASIFPSRTSRQSVVLETLSRSTTSSMLNSFSCFAAIDPIVIRQAPLSKTI